MARAGGHTALSSQWFRFDDGPVEAGAPAIARIAILRHPLDRLRSLYDFYRLRPDLAGEVAETARRLPIGGFLSWLVDNKPQYCNDMQVGLVAGRSLYLSPPTPADRDRAIARMTGLAVPGLVERLEDALLAGEYFLRPTVPALSFADRRCNVSDPGPLDLDGRLARLRRAIGSALFDHLMAMNQLDLALCAAVGSEIDRRLALIPNLEARRGDFRARGARAAAPALAGLLAAE